MAIAADFVARAEAYDGLGNQTQACADLKAALDLLPTTGSDERDRASSFWGDWRCIIDEE